MRIRNRSYNTTPETIGPLEVYGFDPPGLTQTSHVTGLNPGTTSMRESGNEYIEDSDSPNKAGVNDVTHYSAKYTRLLDSNYTEEQHANGHKNTISGPLAHWYSWGTYGVINPTMFDVSWGSDRDALVRAAVAEFRNENKVDNLLNLVEAPELPSSLKNVANLLRKKQYLRAFSGGYLGYSFGIAPLRNDMKKMTNAIPKIRNSFNSALQQTRDVITVHKRSGGNLKLNASCPGYNAHDGTFNGTWEAILLQNVPPVSIVTVEGHRDRPKYYSSIFSKMDDFLRTYGTAGPASFLWERLPYSFVADWFVDTSGIVNSLNEALTGLQSRIIRLSYSRKYDVEISIKKVPNSSWVYSLDDHKLTGHNTLKYYHRESILPTSVGLSSRFGKKQMALSAALLHQIVAKMKSRK